MARVKTEAKERAILEAASQRLRAQAFHDVLIDEIASDAGIGKGTIYRYFETKEDLYFATTLHVLDRLRRLLSQAAAAGAVARPAARAHRDARTCASTGTGVPLPVPLQRRAFPSRRDAAR